MRRAPGGEPQTHAKGVRGQPQTHSLREEGQAAVFLASREGGERGLGTPKTSKVRV